MLSTYRVQFQTQVCGSTFKTRITIRLVDPEVYWWVSTSLISLWRCLKFTWSRPYNMKKTHWPRDFRNRIIEAATNKNHTSLDFIFLPKYFKVQKLKKKNQTARSWHSCMTTHVAICSRPWALSQQSILCQSWTLIQSLANSDMSHMLNTMV